MGSGLESENWVGTASTRQGNVDEDQKATTYKVLQKPLEVEEKPKTEQEEIDLQCEC